VSSSASRVLRAAARSQLASGMSAAAGPDFSLPPPGVRISPSSRSAAGAGLNTLGAAKESAVQGADAPVPAKAGASKAAGANGAKGGPPPARKKAAPKARVLAEGSEQPSMSTKGGPSKAEPKWKAKQALKNLETAGAASKSTAAHVEPLLTNNRSKLPSFNSRERPPVPMYSSPLLPHSYSTATDPRSTAPEPSELNSALHRELLQSWVASRPRPETLEARKVALNRVARAVGSFSGRYQLALFGSVANGVDNDSSDLDICVIVSCRRCAASGWPETLTSRPTLERRTTRGLEATTQALTRQRTARASSTCTCSAIGSRCKAWSTSSRSPSPIRRSVRLVPQRPLL
jgi:hypothetical protein